MLDLGSVHKPAGGETSRTGPVVIRPCGPDVNSHKPQASSLTSGTIPDIKNLERINYENRKK